MLKASPILTLFTKAFLFDEFSFTFLKVKSQLDQNQHEVAYCRARISLPASSDYLGTNCVPKAARVLGKRYKTVQNRDLTAYLRLQSPQEGWTVQGAKAARSPRDIS